MMAPAPFRAFFARLARGDGGAYVSGMRSSVCLIAIALVWTSAALAAGRALDGAPVALNNAQTWCISPREPLPNWDTPAHPDCKMTWRVLAERGDRVLYSARYAWPSPRRTKDLPRVLTEVLYEGVKGSRVVRRLYAVQDDESHVRLEPLRLVSVGGMTIVESRVCMSGTSECGRELAVWSESGIESMRDHTIPEIRALLPKGYDLNATPDIDLGALKGSGKAWAQGDGDCCPSATIEFTLRLDDGELHVRDLKFVRRPA
jgi:hypothetical protein